MSKFSVDDLGRTGRNSGVRGKFDWDLNFTMNILKEVVSPDATGVVAEVTHALTKEKRSVFLSQDALSSADRMTKALNKAFKGTKRPCMFMNKLLPNALKDFIHEKMQEFWMNCTDEELESDPLKLVEVVGKQESGDFVLGPNIMMTSDGVAQTMEEKYVCSPDMEYPVIHRPFNGSNIVTLFEALQQHLSHHHFLKCLLVVGSALKGMFYEDIIFNGPTCWDHYNFRQMQHGKVNDNKSGIVTFWTTTLGKLAQSKCCQIDVQDEGVIMLPLQVTDNFATCIKSEHRCSLPWCINDVLSLAEVSQIIQMAFEDAKVENMKGSFVCHGPPLITCNSDVMMEASSNTRINSRLALIPMLEELELTVAQQRKLKALQTQASGSIGELIRVGKFFQSEEFVQRVEEAKDKIKPMLPSSCPTRDRLAHVYAVDMVSTFVVTELLNLGINEEIWRMFESETVPAIEEFQSTDSYAPTTTNLDNFLVSLANEEQVNQVLAIHQTDSLCVRISEAFRIARSSPSSKKSIKATLRQMGARSGCKRFPGDASDTPKSVMIFKLSCLHEQTIFKLKESLNAEEHRNVSRTGLPDEEPGSDETRPGEQSDGNANVAEGGRDGTETGEQRDGTETGEQRDGTETGEQRDGTETGEHRDGTETGEQRDGTETGEQGDGTETGEQRDGTETGEQTAIGIGDDNVENTEQSTENMDTASESPTTPLGRSKFSHIAGRKIFTELSVNMGNPNIQRTIERNIPVKRHLSQRVPKKKGKQSM